MIPDASPERAMAHALRVLSYRPRSRREVQERLQKRFTTPVVEDTMQRLAEQGLVDDEAFARFWRERGQATRVRSASLLVREMVGKGVAREVAEAAVAGVDDAAAAYQAGRRHVRLVRDLDWVSFHRRMSAYLARRGFSAGVTRTVVQRLWQERAQL